MSAQPPRVSYGNATHSLDDLIQSWSLRSADYLTISQTGANPRNWNLHDLAGDLMLRDVIDEAIQNLAADRAYARLRERLAEADRDYRESLEEDPEGMLRLFVPFDFSDSEWAVRPWWWRGIPGGLDRE